MFFVEISALPPKVHQKLTKHGRCCMQNNQLLTKSYVDFKDNSIVLVCFFKEHLESTKLKRASMSCNKLTGKQEEEHLQTFGVNPITTLSWHPNQPERTILPRRWTWRLCEWNCVVKWIPRRAWKWSWLWAMKCNLQSCGVNCWWVPETGKSRNQVVLFCIMEAWARTIPLYDLKMNAESDRLLTKINSCGPQHTI